MQGQREEGWYTQANLRSGICEVVYMNYAMNCVLHIINFTLSSLQMENVKYRGALLLKMKKSDW